MLRFYIAIAEGDIVVGSYDEGKRLRAGYVTGRYYYEDNAPTYRHRIPVEWCVKDFPKSALLDHVQESMRSISITVSYSTRTSYLQRVRTQPSKVRELRQADDAAFSSSKRNA